MKITPFHAKFFAHELSRVGGSGVDRLGRALFDACVELNPHQIEAALFALRSPLAKGVLLADEVGLGKTIEAALVLCQLWAERKRKLLVICPASLRKQWSLELAEKFNLPSVVLDAKTSKAMQKEGIPNPFRQDGIIITSLHYAAACADAIQLVEWDAVVIDEAHKLRNAHRESNRIGQAIRRATADRRKILLTATPLQNSLAELYGLSVLIDDNLFGDFSSFRTQYMNTGGDFTGLRARLRSFCWRTLRQDVLEYVRYTKRQLVTRPFTPSDEEHQLYEKVSSFLQRDENYALPRGQKHLLVLLVRKVLASSPQAVAGTLEIMLNRLLRLREFAANDGLTVASPVPLEDCDPDLLDELLADQDDAVDEPEPETAPDEKEPVPIDLPRLDREIAELEDYIRWARSLGVDTKSRALLKALEIGFAQMAGMTPPGPRKAVVFTESRRTQAFLRQFLEANGYAGKVLTFNGTNSDPDSAAVYERWLAANRSTGRATGSRSVDLRTALTDEFRDSAEVFIATEAAAEGINLQFCAMIVNYDLPWNPQRIEQRIGRCHRYGQKHDVVVINFLNERNEADRRVQELLQSKFELFNGVFGASDEILGTIESGVDFEKRILEIYQRCRSQAEIAAAFEKLQQELEEQIQNRLQDTRSKLLEHFDEDVHERLKTNLTGATEQLDRMGRMFWHLTAHQLATVAEFSEADWTFLLKSSPLASVRSGRYAMISKERKNVPGEFLYRLSHPLGEHVIETAREASLAPSEVTFDMSSHPAKVSLVENLRGHSGWLVLQHLKIASFEQEEFLLFSAFTDNGRDLDQETCTKLFSVSATLGAPASPPPIVADRLAREAERHKQATVARALEANHRHFQEARERLEKWADDMVLAAERALRDTKEHIKTLQRQARQSPTLTEQHELQKKILHLEKLQRRQRQDIFAAEDEILEKRDQLILSLETRLTQKTSAEELFTLRWRVV